MSFFEIKKTENCISKSSVYQYRFDFKITEEFIGSFEKNAEVKIFKNFPKPSFCITFPDGTKIVGVLRDVAFKVMFPMERAEKCRSNFESVLTEKAMTRRQAE
jgi:hypothetical protein